MSERSEIDQSEVVNAGIYAGLSYDVIRKQDGSLHISIKTPGGLKALIDEGADLTLLSNIGNEDPDEVMEKLFDSIDDKETE